MKRLAIAVSLFLTCFCAGCGHLMELSIDPVRDPVARAISVIDRGIADITAESTSWRNVLQRVAGELPEQISSVIRNDAQNLATRSIAAAGIEVRCNVDFLAARAISALSNLKARLLNQPTAPAPPGFCHVTPNAIELSASPASWSRITLDGYDLDSRDTSGSPLTVLFQDGDGTRRSLPEERIGRTTHYQVTLNLGGLEREIYERRTAKLLIMWGNTTETWPQVVVIPWSPKRWDESVVSSATSYMPPRVRGDRDFDTDDDEPMSIDVRGEVSFDSSTIRSRVFMNAQEQESDWTQVRGHSEWQTIFTARAGTKIVSLTPSGSSRVTANITTHGQQDYQLPAGEAVRRFEVWGDRSGDDAGVYTRMVAYWNSFTVKLEETAPSWMPATSSGTSGPGTTPPGSGDSTTPPTTTPPRTCRAGRKCCETDDYGNCVLCVDSRAICP